MRLATALLALLLLAGCASAPGGKTPRPDPYAGEPGSRARALREAGPTRIDPLPAPPSCVPPREHDESLYTPGGLYAPGVPDSAPPVPVDVSHLPEPVPRREPRAAYGNRETYTVLGRTYRVMASAEGYVERGIASWYGYKFHGRHTSSRERYDMCAFTAAHKTLPLPSYVRVTNLENGRSVVVRVNDRGPFHEGRIIDLSYAAAARLDMKRNGTARVEVRALMGPDDSLVAERPPAPPAPAPPAPLPPPAQRTPPASASVSVSASAPPPPAAVPPPGRPASPVAGPQVVQVGSFGDRLNAERLVGRLAEAGLPGAQLDHAIVGERSLWRVRFPPQPLEAAQALAERIAALGLGTPGLLPAPR
ncbi:septal ring lytic transglycosylase RlpA family protein [Silanimonas lenta]|uniref:septal ring lytic transglycosylase RlpA family protein n=1 Tax=Silanimonas lenta TaxID=265429 RepID=UPI00041E257E|nr:septal ring lytic transglycosylase RlpA family protein [Silanimonas lenta]